jgi:hypothetical protein
MRSVFLAPAVFGLSACGFLAPPKSPGEYYSGYSYVPLDPLPVQVNGNVACSALNRELPDNAVRIAVRDLSGSGSLGFGPVKLGYAGSSYRVILDYINADVANFRFRYGGGLNVLEGATPAFVTRVDRPSTSTAGGGQGEIVIPVYVGVGLRLTADVTVHKGTVNLSSLGSLSAAAEAKRITGSLLVQTLGITGPKIQSALPLPSELNSTTIQNAIVSVGSIKALMGDEGTLLRPRVVGIYNPMKQSNQETINLIVSQLIGPPPIGWTPSCT